MTTHIQPQESVFYDSRDSKLRNLVLAASISLLLINLIVNLVAAPKVDRAKARELPPRLTKLVMEQKKEQEKKKEEVKPPEELKKLDKKDVAKEEKKQEKKEEPKPEPKPEPDKKQEVAAKQHEPQQQAQGQEAPVVPKRSVDEIRKKVASTGLLALQDDLADLRDSSVPTLKGDKPLLTGTPLTAAGGGVGAGRPSAIAAAAARGSAGINTGALSRDVGGKTQLAARQTTQMSSPVKGMDMAKAREEEKAKGPGKRTREEIDIVFDANKGALMAIYQRALRENPGLQGKVVFELTIESEGNVSAASVKSSDLNDAELEKKLAARIKMFRFAAKDVERMTVTVPVNFTPAS